MAVLITAVLAMAVPVTAETVAVPVMVGLATAAKTAVQVVVVRVAAVQVVAVQVVAAARVIPEETNPAAVAKAVPQSHQRNSLL